MLVSIRASNHSGRASRYHCTMMLISRLLLSVHLVPGTLSVPKRVFNSDRWYNSVGKFHAYDRRNACREISLTKCCYDLLIENYVRQPWRLAEPGRLSRRPDQKYHGERPQDWDLPVQAVLLKTRTGHQLEHIIEFTCVDTRSYSVILRMDEATNTRPLRVTCEIRNEEIQTFDVQLKITNLELLQKLGIKITNGFILDAKCIPRSKYSSRAKRPAEVSLAKSTPKKTRVEVKAHENDCVEYPDLATTAQALLVALASSHNDGNPARSVEHKVVTIPPAASVADELYEQSLAQEMWINARPADLGIASLFDVSLAYGQHTNLLEAELDRILAEDRSKDSFSAMMACATAGSSDIALTASIIEPERLD